jgi:hypothetical protein
MLTTTLKGPDGSGSFLLQWNDVYPELAGVLRDLQSVRRCDAAAIDKIAAAFEIYGMLEGIIPGQVALPGILNAINVQVLRIKSYCRR